MILDKGKLNILIDGQFGSTGKGLCSAYVSSLNNIDISITNSGPNSGHTFYVGSTKYVTTHIPVSGILNKNSIIYLCSGSVINPNTLYHEIDKFDIDRERLVIHPRAAIVRGSDIRKELFDDGLKLISSTQSGCGHAIQRKIARTATLAYKTPGISSRCRIINLNESLSKEGCTAFMEMPQGFDLSINSGMVYPYCTSREITVPAALSDAQVHPKFLGKVISSIRTFPIRVGNLDSGYSGPFYEDSEETTWEKLGVPNEYTTKTERIRRVATFSMKQYRRMIECIMPDYVFLNFANYLSRNACRTLLEKLDEVTHIGYGPDIDHIIKRVK